MSIRFGIKTESDTASDTTVGQKNPCLANERPSTRMTAPNPYVDVLQYSHPSYGVMHFIRVH
jgi:hypothetical protein